MTALCFVDTNVLVYRRDKSAAKKQATAANWLQHLWQNRTGRLSVQVLNEFYAVVTRRLKPGLPRAEAQAEVRDLFAWQPQAVTPEVIDRAFKVEKRFGLSYWDSLIVSAAQVSGCRLLLSEDLQDGQVLGTVKVLNPFTHAPGEAISRG